MNAANVTDTETAETVVDGAQGDMDGSESDSSDSELVTSDGEDEKDDSMSVEEEEQFDEEANRKYLVDFREQVNSNPYAYDVYVQLIKQAKRCGELTILREARERMSAVFPLTEELWKEWLDDEVDLIDKNNQEEFSRICALFERSVKDYLSVELWIDFAMFVFKDYSADDSLTLVREIFERGINQVGIHVSEGINLWNAYRQVETGYLQFLTATPGTSEDKIRIQTETVKKLFKRQLSVPLIGMEKVFTEYEEFTDGAPEDQVKKAYNSARKKLLDVLPFEEKLTSAADNEKYGIFLSYIEHEQKAKESLRVRSLYERALVPYCLSLDLWLRCLEFLDRQLMNYDWSIDAHERALRNLPWDFDLWPVYLRALELYNRPKNEFEDLWQRAYSTGCSLLPHYVELWMCKLTYLRRICTAADNQNEEAALELRNTCAEALVDVTEKQSDTTSRVCRFWIVIEVDMFNDIQKARELWEMVMKDHQRESWFWLEYFRFERRLKNIDNCRKILSKAMLRNLDDSEAVAQCWIDFENEFGTLEQLLDAQHNCKSALKKAAERLAKASLQESDKNFTKKKKPAAPRERNQPQRKEMAKEPERTAKRRRSDEQPAASTPPQNGTNWDSEGFKIPAVPGAPLAKPAAKKLKASDASLEQPQSESKPNYSTESPEGPAEKREVYVSNLDVNITETRLFELFSPAGAVKDIRLALYSKTKGASRFGYVEFVHPKAVDAALKLDRTKIDGRPMFVSRHRDAGQNESHYKGKESGQENNTLFASGLRLDVNADQLKALFANCQKLKEVRIPERKSGQLKGIAYIEFEDEDSAKKALMQVDGKELLGKPVKLAISKPKSRDQKTSAPQGIRDIPRNARPVVLPTPAGQRKSRSHVALVPRAVQRPSPSASTASQNSNAATTSNGSTSKGNDYFRSLTKK